MMYCVYAQGMMMMTVTIIIIISYCEYLLYVMFHTSYNSDD